MCDESGEQFGDVLQIHQHFYQLLILRGQVDLIGLGTGIRQSFGLKISNHSLLHAQNQRSLLDVRFLQARVSVMNLYAESFARPLPRRADKTARPARVAMRARKPCFLARRRVLGWKVRFVIKNSYY